MTEQTNENTLGVKCEVEEVATCRKRLKVEVPVEGVKSIFDNIYNTVRNQVQIKGFRKGRAPRKQIERRFGKEITEDARSRLFQESFSEAVKQHDLSPMADPDIDPATLAVETDKPFSYETEVDVAPDFELPEYKNLDLKEEVEAVSDGDIDEQIERMRQSFTTFEERDGKAEKEDSIVADASLTCDGETLVEVSEQRIIVDGNGILGIKLDDVPALLTGLAKGDDKEVEITLPDDFHKEEHRGKKAKLQLKVAKVEKSVLPEVDEEFAKRFGLPSLEVLKERIKQNIENERKGEARQKMEQEATEKLIAACSFDLPEKFLEDQINLTRARTQMRLAQMGVPTDDTDERKKEVEETTAKETEESIRRSIIFNKIADVEKIEVSEADIQRHMQQLAMAYRTTPAELFKQVQANNGLYQLVNEIRDIKTTQFILDNAKVDSNVPAEDKADEKKEDA